MPKLLEMRATNLGQLTGTLLNRDIKKLRTLASETVGSKCYFVLAGRKYKLENLDRDLKGFIEAHGRRLKKWQE